VQNGPMIHFEGTLTPEIYRRALGVTGRSGRWVAWILILAGVVNLFFAHLDRPVTWGMPLLLALFGVMLLIMPRYAVTKAFATDRLLSDPVTGDADEHGVRLESAHGRSDLPWSLMHKVVVTANLVTIYQSASIVGSSSLTKSRGRASASSRAQFDQRPDLRGRFSCCCCGLRS